MAPSRKRRRTEEKLTLEDVMCPICRSIIIEPVSLPCKQHILCYYCFEKTIESTTLTCPLCRKRIGSWLRSATKNRSLINQPLWSKIQEQFPEQIQSKLNGEDDGVEEQVVGGCDFSKTLSTPGEIKKEFEEQLKKYSEELSHEKQQEEKASVEFISKLLETEISDTIKRKSELIKIVESDENLAKSLQLSAVENVSVPNNIAQVDHKRTKVTKLNSNLSKNNRSKNSTATIEKYFDPTRRLSSSSSRISRLSRDSCNSIDTEFSHFKPIIKEPKTPPKKMPDGRILDSKPRKIQPINLELSGKLEIPAPSLKGPIVQLTSDSPKAFLQLHPSVSHTTTTDSCFSTTSNEKSFLSSSSVANTSVAGQDSDTDFEDENEDNDLLATSSTAEQPTSLLCDASIHLYSVLEEELRMRLRQEEEDFKFAQYLQNSLNEEAKKKAKMDLKSDYQLRSRPSRVSTRTSVGRQTTLDKHVQPVTL